MERASIEERLEAWARRHPAVTHAAFQEVRFLVQEAVYEARETKADGCTVRVLSDCQITAWRLAAPDVRFVRQPVHGCTCDVCEDNRKPLVTTP